VYAGELRLEEFHVRIKGSNENRFYQERTMKLARRRMFGVVATIGALSGIGTAARGDLLLYDPFDYTAGQNLGGSGVSSGSPIGQTNTYTGGGTWYARGTSSNYQSAKDALISSGNLSYTGLAPSVGNSVSYGSSTGDVSQFSDTIDIPGADITSGNLYASFIIRIKSNAVAAAGTIRHSPAGFVQEVSDGSQAGLSLGQTASGSTNYANLLMMRRDATTVGVTNFSPTKTNVDGIGAGATGPSAGYQASSGGTNIVSNQYGDVDGQTAPTFADSGTWQTYFVVMKYAFDVFPDPANHNNQSDAVSLWLNPGSGTLAQANGETLATQNPSGNLGSYYAAINAFGTGTPDAAAFRSFALLGHRQNTDNTIAVDIDELRIGTTWADVTPTGPQTYYWDTNNSAAGAGGGGFPAGIWDGANTYFNTDSTGGGGGTITATPGASDIVVFAAGNDATGSYAVTVSGTRSAGAVKVEEGSVTLSGGNLITPSVDVSAGATAKITSNLTGPAASITKSGNGVLQLQKLPQNQAMTITAGTVKVNETSPTFPDHPAGDDAYVSQPKSLSVSAGATLDLTNNDMIIAYGASTPYAGVSPAAAIEDLIATGFNGGDWLGDGITSSAAASEDAAGNFVLAIVDNASLPQPYGVSNGGDNFDGVDVPLESVLVKVTHRVDLNLDGLVTDADAIIFSTNYESGAPANWGIGDLDYDGVFSDNDAIIFGTFYDTGLAHLPEPASIGVLGIAAAGLLARRRRA
jgi:hypothetical protein